MTNPIGLLQTACGIHNDGVWGPNTYKAGRTHFGFNNNQAAHFFGQCYHESGGFTQFTENLNYADTGLVRVFKKYFPTIASTAGYARNPQKIANKVYSNRMGNGSESSGNGYKFRGRGLIQLTGKSNYTAFATAINRPDILTNPNIVAEELAFESALWFFKKNGLLVIANRGIDVATITIITKRINGGVNGLAERITKTQKFASWI